MNKFDKYIKSMIKPLYLRNLDLDKYDIPKPDTFEFIPHSKGFYVKMNDEPDYFMTTDNAIKLAEYLYALFKEEKD